MTQSNRRNFLKSSAISVAAVASAPAFSQTLKLSNKTIAEVRALEAKDIQATTVGWNDGLAHPIP